jgi:hypothetical protein
MDTATGFIDDRIANNHDERGINGMDRTARVQTNRSGATAAPGTFEAAVRRGWFTFPGGHQATDGPAPR